MITKDGIVIKANVEENELIIQASLTKIFKRTLFWELYDKNFESDSFLENLDEIIFPFRKTFHFVEICRIFDNQETLTLL